MSHVIRTAGPADADQIATILSDWIDETDWMPRIHTREEDRTFGQFLIEKTDVTVVGATDVKGFMARRENSIDALYVRNQDRGGGVGTALIDHAKSERNQLELWTFQSNLHARGFYKSLGFLEDRMTDGQDNDEKLPDVHMTWVKGASLAG